MKSYDLMLMSCEGSDNDGAGAVSLAVRQNVKDFADAGGRVFGSHWHNTWVFDGPAPWPTVATRSSGAHGFDTDITATIDTSFPKGVVVLGLDGQRRRLDHRRPDPDPRRRAQRRRRQGAARAAVDLRHRHDQQQADGPVLLLQHARRGRPRTSSAAASS